MNLTQKQHAPRTICCAGGCVRVRDSVPLSTYGAQALHPIFEKATQILQLSPTYKDKYDFTWVGKDCGDGVSGGMIDEIMPFTGAPSCVGVRLWFMFARILLLPRTRMYIVFFWVALWQS